MHDIEGGVASAVGRIERHQSGVKTSIGEWPLEEASRQNAEVRGGVDRLQGDGIHLQGS